MNKFKLEIIITKVNPETTIHYFEKTEKHKLQIWWAWPSLILAHALFTENQNKSKEYYLINAFERHCGLFFCED